MRYIKLDDSPLNIRPEDDALELYIDEEVFAQLALDQIPLTARPSRINSSLTSLPQ